MSEITNSINVSINGTQHSFATGMTVLEALAQCGVTVPHLCHDERIKPIAACRLCVVRIAGHGHPIPACVTQIADQMEIETHTSELESLRRTNLSLIAKHYPPEAVAAAPQHPFHQLLQAYQVTAGGAEGPPAYHDDSHPYLGLAMDRCIHCYRCVRICSEVQGADVWQVWGRGPQTHVAARAQLPLIAAGCVSCGACSDTCPTDAIFDKREGVATRWTRSTCVYCGVGCQLHVGTNDDLVVAIRPASASVNRGHLCAKGRYGFEFNHAPDRITTPMIRQGSRWLTASWDTALDELALRLTDILQRPAPDGGPTTIGMLGSARATNEENYYAQKFARLVIGSNHIDCCARVCHQPTATAMKWMLGTGAATNSFDDIDHAATFLIAGSNPTENHPIVGARIRQAVLHGARLIVIDPRKTEVAELADHHLQLHAGTNILVLNALAATIIEEQLTDQAFLTQRVENYEAFAKAIVEYLPEKVAQRCGVEAGQLRAAARLYATHRPSMCWHGLGMTEHLQGTEGVMALINLALLTGNLGRRGTGINPLRGQNNVQGAAHMGCEPQTLTGGQPLDEARLAFENTWQAPLPHERGWTLLEMMDAAQRGEFKALWAIGYDIYLTLAHEAATAQALQQLELLIVQDLFLNETARHFAHFFLPAASVFEKDGTFMNSDRRVHRVRAALQPPGDSRPDTWILAQVAQRMGHAKHFAHADAEEIWNEVRRVWPGGAGLSYDRLSLDPPHWPCPDSQHPGTEVLHSGRFAHATKTALQLIEYTPSSELLSQEYPYRLTTGRHLYQFNAGTMTQRTTNTKLQARDVLEIHPEDAQQLSIADGEWVLVESRYGRVELPARISSRVRQRELFTTFHDPTLFVNRLTSPIRDRHAHAPEYKLTCVRISRSATNKVERQ